MPTYKNDSTAARNVVNAANKLVWVKPGETVETYQLLTAEGLTKTSDSPYYNPVLAVHNTISSTGSDDPTTISLQSGCDCVRFWNNSSANITVFLNAAGNTPGYLIPSNAKDKWTGLSGYVDTLVLQFSAAVSSGELIVYELEG